MARHRGVRNRQFSYDEGDDDYYDEDEEEEFGFDEHSRQHGLSGRGDGPGISLSSYFDVPVVPPRQSQQQQHQQRRHQHERDGQGFGDSDPLRFPDRNAPDKRENGNVADEDPGDELVTAIAGELEGRLGRGRFSRSQIREAVVSSGFEVETAEALLLSADEPKMQNAGSTSLSEDVSMPSGRPADQAVHTEAPSSLAFGLCVEGHGHGRRKGPATVPDATAVVPPPHVGEASEVWPFGFDTPSPDDVNLSKQAAARARGGLGVGMSKVDGGHIPAKAPGPKAKVVHITGSMPKKPTRKSLDASNAASPAIKSPTTSRDRSPPLTKPPSSQQPPTRVGPISGRAAVDDRDQGEAEGKERLAMVVIGHVDAGKSTLMGQVLVQMGQVSQRALHKQEKEAREAGKASFYLAWVMDEEQSERAHGVTIDVAQKYIETDTKLVTLLDAPGHRDFIPKMISGTSAADAAVLVIPAAIGEFESGFQDNGQTKEHATLAKALGVNQLIVVVNKLDATDPPWSRERYEAVQAEVAPFLARTHFRPKKVRFVPACGLSGENVSKRNPDGPLSSWYDGPTLLEAIDTFSPAPKAVDKPLRMCIADVTSSGKGVSVSGRVVRGRIRTGDKVAVMPLEDVANVARLERNGAPAREARAGDNAEVTLSGVDAARVVVGNVLCKTGDFVLPAVRKFNAQIVALHALEVPIIKGTEFQLHMHNLDVMVHCSKLVALTSTAGEVTKPKPRCVSSGATAQIRLTSSKPICLEKYSDCRALGRFVLRQKGATVAVGLVLGTEMRGSTRESA